jgi:hypothetical protein
MHTEVVQVPWCRGITSPLQALLYSPEKVLGSKPNGTKSYFFGLAGKRLQMSKRSSITNDFVACDLPISQILSAG